MACNCSGKGWFVHQHPDGSLWVKYCRCDEGKKLKEKHGKTSSGPSGEVVRVGQSPEKLLELAEEDQIELSEEFQGYKV